MNTIIEPDAPAHCGVFFSRVRGLLFGMTAIVFEALHADVRAPRRGTSGSAGYDLAAYLTSQTVRVWRDGVSHERPCQNDGGVFTLTLAPGEKALVPLGFKASLPPGYE